MNKAIFIFLALTVVQTISATEVKVCDTGAIDSSSTTIEDCNKPPCYLKRGNSLAYSIKFTPSSPVDDLIAHIEAHSKPMIRRRVDTFLHGSACDKIFKASDDSPASCPLSPGVEYIYKDKVPIPNIIIQVTGTIKGFLKSNSTIVKCIEFVAKLV